MIDLLLAEQPRSNVLELPFVLVAPEWIYLLKFVTQLGLACCNEPSDFCYGLFFLGLPTRFTRNPRNYGYIFLGEPSFGPSLVEFPANLRGPWRHEEVVRLCRHIMVIVQCTHASMEHTSSSIEVAFCDGQVLVLNVREGFVNYLFADLNMFERTLNNNVTSLNFILVRPEQPRR